VGSSWDDLFFKEEKINKLVINNELKNLIINEFNHSDLFAIKDPRIVLLFPVYKSVLEELDINIKIVIPFRNPAEVATSLRERNGFSLEKGMLLWAYHLLLAEKYSRGFDRVFIEFNDLISNTTDTVALISEKLNINFLPKYAISKNQINDYLEPELKHHNLTIDDLSINNTKIIQEIIQLKDKFNDESVIGKLDKIREELFSYHNIFYNEDITGAFEDLKITKQDLIFLEKELQKRNEELVDTVQQLRETQSGLQRKSKDLENTRQQLNQMQQDLKQRADDVGKYKQLLIDTESGLQNSLEELEKRDRLLNEARLGLNQKTEEIGSLRRKISDTEHMLFQRDGEVRKYKEEIVAIYTGRSWRITRPLRKLKRVLK
jgi:hypothetical protein